MKIIEGMKQIKDLQRKAEDLRTKIGRCSADLDFETQQYPDQAEKVKGWLQAHSDILKEILDIRLRIQVTNIYTMVDIELGGRVVRKSIAEWIHRRRDLAKTEFEAWRQLTDKGLKEGQVKQSDGSVRDVRLRRYYDPTERDEKLSLFKSEPLLVDAKLEVVNAITDLLEYNPVDTSKL